MSRLAGLAAAATAIAAASCGQYVIEHHTRPGFYQLASATPLPDEVVAPDGRVIRFTSDGGPAAGPGDGGEAADPLPIWEENERGEVRMLCFLPSDVIANLMHCLRLERYDLLFGTLLAEEARLEYLATGRTAEDFAVWCATHRRDLMAMLNRMSFGMLGGEVVVERISRGVIRCRFNPQVASQFRFREVWMTSDPPGLKLLAVR
jgi:hypothetical protein